MVHLLSRRKPIRGLSTIECALVLPLCIMVLVGIIEGARVIAARELLDNAAREGARLAAVSTTSLTTADIQAAVSKRFSGQTTAPNLTVLVYRADPVTGQNLGAWTDAGRGDCIAVEATASHTVAMPLFGLLPNTLSLHAKSLVYSEGN